MKFTTKVKIILSILIFLPLFGIGQTFETNINESYFQDELGNIHKGVGHTYEYLSVIEYEYSRKDYFTVNEDWVKKTFSLFFDFFYDGKGNKYFYNYNSQLSQKGNLVFDLKNGDKIILLRNMDLWHFSDYNYNSSIYESLWTYSKVSKSRWLDD